MYSDPWGENDYLYNDGKAYYKVVAVCYNRWNYISSAMSDATCYSYTKPETPQPEVPEPVEPSPVDSDLTTQE